MASITLQRDVKANLNSINKVDGQILFTTDKDENNNIYTDVLREDGSIERIQIGGLLPSQEQAITDGVKNVAQSETNAANSAKLSESWAKGGTNSRDGEDTNNSKYYSNQSSNSATNAKSWAIGTTNSRDGEDTNNSKYYSEQSKTYDTESKSYAVGGTNTRTGEDTDNSKYYSEQSDKSSKTSESWAIGGTNTRKDEDTNNSKYYSEQSNNSSQSAKDSATLSESWAIGGTGKREGENTNNAKHWAKQAKASADSAAQGMKPATSTSVGAVKPDNVTTVLDSTNAIVAQELQSVTQAQFDSITTKSNKIAYLIQSENDATSGTIYYDGRYYGNTSIQSMTKTEYDALDASVQNTHTYLITDD